jgi:hypothetical protein
VPTLHVSFFSPMNAQNLVTGDSPPSTVGLGRWFDPDACATISLQQSEWRPQLAGEGKRGGRVPPPLPPNPAQVSESFSFFLSRGRAAAQLEQYGAIGDG